MNNDTASTVIKYLTLWSCFILAALVYVGHGRAQLKDELAAVQLSIQEADGTPPPVLKPDLPELDPCSTCEASAAEADALILIVNLGLDIVRLGKENDDLKAQIAGEKRHLSVHHANVSNLTIWLRSSQTETARLRDLNDELRGYTGGP